MNTPPAELNVGVLTQALLINIDETVKKFSLG